LSEPGGSSEIYTIKHLDEPGDPGVAAAEIALEARARALLAREQAVLVREGAADRRARAASQRDRDADQREQSVALTTALRVKGENELREANERLIVAAVDAQTAAEEALHATALMAVKAERDFLTGLPNRALLADRLAQSIEFAQRHGKRVALLFLDLDNFKEINDSLGHAVGDALLLSAAKRLQACVRASDTVSRQGGDEFIVLLTEVTTAQDAAIVADMLLKAMAEPHFIDSREVHITVSIGISLYPDDSEGVESVLTQADAAMYSAKRWGRNTYRRFTPDMRADPAAERSR
jgi:diguanylate cyclase (GGDEF)-like protein